MSMSAISITRVFPALEILLSNYKSKQAHNSAKEIPVAHGLWVSLIHMFSMR